MSRFGRIENITRQTLLAERAEVADNSWRRMKGLLGRSTFEPGQALIIEPCQGVHTWFMSFPIDVLHVDADGSVQRVLHELGPNRIGPIIWRTRYVIELPAGVARASRTEPGDRLRVA